MTTKSERVAKRILGGALAKSGWAFLMKIRLQDVLERDDLTKADPEWTLYTTGHFDFVVCHTSNDLPVFALEIDGRATGLLDRSASTSSRTACAPLQDFPCCA